LNKILIFAGAIEARLLIEKISQNYLNLAEYHIIYENNEIRNSFKEKENLFFYKINFHAYNLYKNLINKDFNKIILFIKNKETAEFVLKKLKFTKIPLLFVKFWLNFPNLSQYSNLEIIDIPDITTNKIIDFIPGIPLFARDIGLGIGEIMEVEVPIGSPFIYKNPEYIEERYKVKVGGIYRNNQLLTEKERDKNIILPNDKLLIIGKPEVVKTLFYQIKKPIGSFPQPYGNNIYLILDMLNMKKKEISQLLKTALFLHRKLQNQKLIIKVINPTSFSKKMDKLYKFPNIDIYTNYLENSYINILMKDSKIFNIGLIITNNNFFKKYSSEFFEIQKPILKIGEESIKKCKNLTIILNENIKKIANVIFDISYQLNIKLQILNADPENTNKELVEYIQHLSKLFNFKNIEFISTKENPIIKLKKENNICLIEVIDSKPISKIKQILFPKIKYSYLMLDKYNQFLIPILKENNESENINS